MPAREPVAAVRRRAGAALEEEEIALADQDPPPSGSRLQALRTLPRRHVELERRVDQLEAQVADLYDATKAVREYGLGLRPHIDRLNDQVPDIYQRMRELRDQLTGVISRIDERAGESSARVDLLTEKVHELRDVVRPVRAALETLEAQLEEQLGAARDAATALSVRLERVVEADLDAAAATGRLLLDAAARLERVESLGSGDAGTVVAEANGNANGVGDGGRAGSR